MRGWRGTISLLVLLAGVAGCGQPLRTLMELGKEQDALQYSVRSQGVLFAELLRDVEQGALAMGTTRAAIVSRYGRPVLERGSVFLYRYPVAFFQGPKVYLEFDAAGRLENIRLIERSGS